MQGFIISKALGASEIPALLARLLPVPNDALTPFQVPALALA